PRSPLSLLSFPTRRSSDLPALLPVCHPQTRNARLGQDPTPHPYLAPGPTSENALKQRCWHLPRPRPAPPPAKSSVLPRRWCAVGVGVGGGDHLLGEFGLGCEVHAVGDPGRVEVLGLLGPGPGQVETVVDQGVPCAGGIGEVEGGLGAFDPAGGAGGTSRPRSGWGRVALETDGCGAFLQVAGL